MGQGSKANSKMAVVTRAKSPRVLKGDLGNIPQKSAEGEQTLPRYLGNKSPSTPLMERSLFVRNLTDKADSQGLQKSVKAEQTFRRNLRKVVMSSQSTENVLKGFTLVTFKNLGKQG